MFRIDPESYLKPMDDIYRDNIKENTWYNPYSMTKNTFPELLNSIKRLPLVNEEKPNQAITRRNQLLYLAVKRNSLGSYPGLAVRLTG